MVKSGLANPKRWAACESWSSPRCWRAASASSVRAAGRSGRSGGRRRRKRRRAAAAPELHLRRTDAGRRRRARGDERAAERPRARGRRLRPAAHGPVRPRALRGALVRQSRNARDEEAPAAARAARRRGARVPPRRRHRLRVHAQGRVAQAASRGAFSATQLLVGRRRSSRRSRGRPWRRRRPSSGRSTPPRRRRHRPSCSRSSGLRARTSRRASGRRRSTSTGPSPATPTATSAWRARRA